MCQVRFIGCLHLGHRWMANHRGFNDEFYHDEYLIDEWNKIVGKKDITYILGDITMENTNSYYKLDRLNGVKHVVLGNHDMPQHVRELLKYVTNVAGMFDYKGGALTHCPVHPCEMGRYRFNIHAHIHENKLAEVISLDSYGDHDSVFQPTLSKYINVDAKLIDFKPRTLEQLINK